MKLYHELKELWAKASMEARKWVSNYPKVLEVIPEKYQASKITINDGENPTTKTLGLAWNSQKDKFKIPTSEMPRLQITKRNVLKKIATIFDPLGFISPFIVIAKILLQELWSRGYGWDDKIKDEIALRLEQWFHQLPMLNTVTVPRCLRAAEPVRSREIITFADASPEIGADGSYYGIAVNSIVQVLGIPMRNVSFYSDSMDVLWWIRGSEPCSWGKFHSQSTE